MDLLLCEYSSSSSMVRDLVSRAWMLAENYSLETASAEFQKAISIDRSWFAESEYARFLFNFIGAEEAIDYWEDRHHKAQADEFSERAAVAVCNQVAEFYRALRIHASARLWQQRAVAIEMKYLSPDGLSDTTTYGFACDLLHGNEMQSARKMFLGLSRSLPGRRQIVCELALLKLAELALVDGDLETVLQLTKDVEFQINLDELPKMAIHIWMLRSQVFERLSEYEQAGAAIDEASYIARRHARCRRMLSEIDNRKRVIEQYQAVVSYNPQWN